MSVSRVWVDPVVAGRINIVVPACGTPSAIDPHDEEKAGGDEGIGDKCI
ncbi:hypothetical protein NKH10_31585 [Mesorhizobium sp. M1340]